ncbi:MAG: type II secretion system protein GspC [Pseudomonadota bacterium]|nr:type II secretion system protein GspC [Pseudomonadota bacterium]
MLSLAIPQSALQGWFRPERIAQLTRLVNVLLILWLAWLSAKLTWLLVPEAEQTEQAVTLAPAPVQRQPPRIDERQIADWHLFGVAGEEKPVEKKLVDAPETRLKLTLRGVFASEESTGGRAIVGDPKGKEETYAVGDPLPGGARLSEIYPDRIILERNGRFETLRLPKQRALSSSDDTGNRSPIRPGSASSSAKVAAFQKYRKEIKRNPASFMNYVQAAPYREKGKFVGFKLQPGRQPDAFNALGLQSGDIVTAINGVQIDSPSSGMKAMRALGDGDTVNVMLLRGGQETSLSLLLP